MAKIEAKEQARRVAREAARKAYANGAAPAQAALVGRRVAARMAAPAFYTPMFFKSQHVPVASISEDPTVMYHPLARATLNQRDPTTAEVEEREDEVVPAGTEGFFDTLPSWVIPVAIGAIAVLAIVMISRFAQNPAPAVRQD